MRCWIPAHSPSKSAEPYACGVSAPAKLRTRQARAYKARGLRAAVLSHCPFDGEKLVKPGYLTVFLNGILLHNRKEIMGITAHRDAPKYQPQAAEESLVLQNHNGGERFRNIWVRRLGGYDQPEK